MELSDRNFGLLIAYVIPGMTALWGLAAVNEPLHIWLLGADSAGPTVGAALCIILSSTGAGLVLSAVRFLILDSLHGATGVRRPVWNDDRLSERLSAFQYIVENHYRYYQAHSHLLIAALWAYLVHRLSWTGANPVFDVVIGAVCVTLFIASRDALKRYYARVVQLLGTLTRTEVRNEQRQSQRRKVRPRCGAQCRTKASGGRKGPSDHEAGRREDKRELSKEEMMEELCVLS